MKRNLLRWIVLGGGVFAFVCLAYAGSLGITTYQCYRYLKERNIGWDDSLFELDDMLGYRPKPGARGFQVFPIPPDIPVAFDEEGFRVIPDAPPDAARQRPSVLALGCSYTYGGGCPAEDTYCHQLSQLIDGKVMNAGRSGYGLAGMLFLARSLIHDHKPDYTVVQYSPWLAERSQTLYLPTVGAQVYPVCYFCEGRDGRLQFHPPVFGGLPLNAGSYRETPAGVGDFLSFSLTRSFPHLLYSHANVVAARLKLFLGAIPPPARDSVAIVKQTYGELSQLCQDNNSRMIVLWISDRAWDGGGSEGGQNNIEAELAAVKETPHCIFVDGDKALSVSLEKSGIATYSEAYMHFRGTPPQLVDTHPNRRAHAVLAQALAEVILGDS